MPSFTFKKEERLKSRKIIGSLFKEGKSFSMFPLRLVWKVVDREQKYPVQFTVSIPKRSFPRAVHRNQIRRKVREAYRLQKHLLYEALADHDQQYALMFLFIGKKAMTYQEIDHAANKVIKRFIRQLNKGK